MANSDRIEGSGCTTDGKLRFLVVVAHPHDFTHCAGTCGIHTSRGDEVTVVSVTGGADTHNERLYDELRKPPEQRDPEIVNQSREEYAAAKAKEFSAICSLFGVMDGRILGYQQPFRVARTPQVIETLRDIIYETRPHALITQRPHLDGRHQKVSAAGNDHLEVACAVMEARQLAAIPDYQTMRAPHTIAATYFPGVYYTHEDIDFYVDISEWIDQRVAAETMFVSQGQTEAFARKRVSIGAGAMGWYAHREYAEGFVREQAEVLPRIIVPEAALEQADGSRVDVLRRMAGELQEGNEQAGEPER